MGGFMVMRVSLWQSEIAVVIAAKVTRNGVSPEYCIRYGNIKMTQRELWRLAQGLLLRIVNGLMVEIVWVVERR